MKFKRNSCNSSYFETNLVLYVTSQSELIINLNSRIAPYITYSLYLANILIFFISSDNITLFCKKLKRTLAECFQSRLINETLKKYTILLNKSQKYHVSLIRHYLI